MMGTFSAGDSPAGQRRRLSTLARRQPGSALVAWPLGCFGVAADGNTYLFLAPLPLAPVAGLIPAANSLFRLVRCRLETFWVRLAFIFVGAAGFLKAWYSLPRFLMH